MFQPDSADIVSPLQLGAMFEFDATYRALVMHNVLEQNAAMHSELPTDNVIPSHYGLQAIDFITSAYYGVSISASFYKIKSTIFWIL